MALPKSGKISASEIVVNFRPSSNSAPHAISEYYRAHPNGNVKDFLSNKSIPAYSLGSKELKWSDFHGTGLQPEYDWPIPNICTDTFHLFSTAADNWDMVKDSTNEYVGRNETAASMSIPVFNEQATISIPALKIDIGSEIGDDLRYERILENTSQAAIDLDLPTTSFSPGNWQMIIPKKFKRLRIMLTSGGGSGSVQKTVLDGEELKNSAIKGIEEAGYDGENSSVWSENLSIELQGGAGGGRTYVQTESTISNPIVVGGSETSHENKLADSPTKFVVTGDVEPRNGDLSFNRDNIPINILHKASYSSDDRNHLKSRPSGIGERSLFGTGGMPGAEYSYGGTPYSFGDITQVSESSFGVGGAAGQHGHRGSDVAGWTTTQSGQSGVTGYFGDFEVSGGDIVNIKVGSGGKNSINEYDDFAPETVGEYNTGRTDIRISESGYGGNGVVQIIGSHGQAHSKISHAGWILEDDLGNILASSYSRAVSSRGVTTLQGALTSPREVDVVGSNNAETPKMYRLRFSVRIGKNGDVPMKTSFCHVGSKFVKVKALSRKIFLNTPVLETLYQNPDSSLEVEQVTGVSKNRDTIDMEYIDNWFIEKCDIRFDLSHRGSYNNSATFVKVPSTNENIGPNSFTLDKSQSVIEFTMAARERYKLSVGNMSAPGSATSSNHRLASYLRSRTQFQLDETSGDGMNSFASADMAVTYTGMGGFYLGDTNSLTVKIDKSNSDASGIQTHHLAHRINHKWGNGFALGAYNSNWTIEGKKLTSTNFPELWEYKTVTIDKTDGTDAILVYWIKNNWETLAYSTYETTAQNTTYFSCGYRGNNTSGKGTTKPHTWVAPPPPKKDKWYDVNIKWFCFLAGTMVTMEDGSKKAIETIDLGEKVKIGGAVFACAKFVCSDLHDYHGIKVSGSHMVLENDKWIRVEESKDSTLISNESVTVYNFGTENRRLEIEGITFTDYFEIDEKVKLERLGNMYFDHWEDYMGVRNDEVAKIINEKE